MVANIIAKAVSAILILQLCFVVTKAQQRDVDLGLEEYIQQYQRQYSDNVITFDQQLNEFRAVFEQKLSAIGIESPLIERKLDETKNKFDSMELLNSLNKRCVQQYRSKLFDKASVKKALETCANQGKSYLNSILANPTNVRTNLKTYCDNTVPNGLLNCKKTYPITNAQYTPCHMNVIDTANKDIEYYEKQFAQYLKESQCTGDARIKTTFECSSSQLYAAIGSIRETTGLIDFCIANQGTTCAGNNKDFAACPNTMSLTLKATDFNSFNIKNPFYGMSNASGCVVVNFA